ncbi:phytoene desaturase [Nocardia amikacinitolerans]|uniref:phytoene desaturase family protein n=1 Tax=Nocardia amikacinitolerans TaxID=756689 RepID=UPI0020A41B53|nr:phytoene desaturase family protein [Nocardia amikacinitolerans]MCP2298658.1 phytoene desaturase [Nocardia amikacinitolerans]
MRTVKGRPDHIVVVGAGLAGLSAAIHLAGRGRAVTVIERAAVPGGRMGRLDLNGCRLDTGPTVLTMPELIDEIFDAVGERTGDRLELMPVVPAYRARFADGRTLDVHSDEHTMARAITEFAGADQAEGYRRLRDWLTRLYHAEFDRFIATNFDSPLSMLTPALAKLAALGGFGNWDRRVARFITDPDLRRVFTFQSLYAGVAPDRALAAYAVIAYMDTVAGVYFPRGGMRAVPDALAAAAEAAGVRFHYQTTVTALAREGARVHAVHTDRGDRIACDAVVLTTERHRTYALLGHRSRRPIPVVAAPSAAVLHVSCDPLEIPHHSLLFGAAWQSAFHDIIGDGRVPSDPSLLVTRPTAGDPTLAPEGRDLLYILAPVPNLERGRIDWPRFGIDYAEQVLDIVRKRLGPSALRGAQLLRVVTPTDWAARDMLSGSPFALAHTFAQTGPFRPANMIRGIDNAVLAGASTVPGVGIPPVLISGRLAADRVTGPVRSGAARRPGNPAHSYH